MISVLSVSAQNFEWKHMNKYTQAEGLSSYNVRNVFQDSKGFMWISTQDALSRFDGTAFINYNKTSEIRKRILGIDIWKTVEDTTTGLLWVLPAETGINAIDILTGNVVKSIPVPISGADEWNLCMIISNRELWIGTSIGVKIYDLNSDKFIPALPVPYKPENPIDFETRCIAQDTFGNNWVCYDGYGIVIYEAHTKKILKQLPFSELKIDTAGKTIRFYSSILLSGNEIVFATTEGLRSAGYDANYSIQINPSPVKGLPFLNQEAIKYISKTADGTVYIAAKSGFYKLPETLASYAEIRENSVGLEGAWLNTVNCIWQDSFNNIWLGCKQGLAFIKNDPNPFRSFYIDGTTNEKLEHVRTVFRSESGNLIAGLNNGLANINRKDGGFTITQKNKEFSHIFQDRLGKIFISSTKGMEIYEDGSLRPVGSYYSELAPFSSFQFNSHLFVGDSLVVIGTENNEGVLMWNSKSHKVIRISTNTSPVKLGSEIVNKVYYDSLKRLWVLSDNLVTLITDNFTKATIHKYTNLNRSDTLGLFFDVCEAGGDLWLASYGNGLVKLKHDLSAIDTIYTSAQMLSNDGVYQLFRYRNSIIITTNNGLSVIDIATRKFKNYFQNDGLHSAMFEEASGIMYKDTIYAGGVNGFTIIDPSLLSINKRPPVLYISDIKIKGESGDTDTSNILISSINIHNDAFQTTIYFSALNYTNPTRTTYKVRIDGDKWLDLGTTNFYTPNGFSPGSYELEVQAFNEDGVPSEIKKLILIFEPKWYQTWWFKLAVLLAVTSLLYLLYRYRVKQILKVERIRQKLSNDLHDDIGSTLNSVNLFTKMEMMQPGKGEYLPQIKDGVQSAITGVRDIIWILDKEPETIESIFGRISSFSLPMTQAAGCGLEIIIADDLKQYSLAAEEKRNVYLVIKEAVNNCIKYAGCKTIRLEAVKENNQVIITIADDGKGFDNTGKIKVSEGGGGNGLKNMQLRCNEIKWKLAVDSAPGKGTSIQLSGRIKD